MARQPHGFALAPDPETRLAHTDQRGPGREARRDRSPGPEQGGERTDHRQNLPVDGDKHGKETPIASAGRASTRSTARRLIGKICRSRLSGLAGSRIYRTPSENAGNGGRAGRSSAPLLASDTRRRTAWRASWTRPDGAAMSRSQPKPLFPLRVRTAGRLGRLSPPTVLPLHTRLTPSGHPPTPSAMASSSL